VPAGVENILAAPAGVKNLSQSTALAGVEKNQRASQCGKPFTVKRATQPNFRCENLSQNACTTFSICTRSPHTLSTPARAHFLLSTPARAHFLLSTLARSPLSLSTPAGAQSWLRTQTIGQSVLKNPKKLFNSTDFRQHAVTPY
jgi:hypothetical protein